MNNTTILTAGYESPRVEMISITAERGFAESGWGDGTQVPGETDNIWVLDN